MSFLSAGLIDEAREADRPSGSGLLGVAAGFLLVFGLVAALSFVRAALPRSLDIGLHCPAHFDQQPARGVLDGQRRLLHREASWIMESPPGPRPYSQRPQCRN